MYRKFFYIQNSFGVHMIWIISVLSLMPKGEIVGIKLVFPLVTTLSYIKDSTELRSYYSVHRVTIQDTVFTESPYRIQCSPSHHTGYSDYRGIVSTE